MLSASQDSLLSRTNVGRLSEKRWREEGPPFALVGILLNLDPGDLGFGLISLSFSVPLPVRQNRHPPLSIPP